MSYEAAVTAPVGKPPPGLIRLERRLGLPVPVAWRPWVADDILSDEWGGRRIRRVRWVRSHRGRLLLAILCFEAVLAAALVVVSESWVFIGTFTVAPVLFAGRNFLGEAPGADELIGHARIQSLQWHGLRPDGSLDPEPNRLWTLAALPPGSITVLAVVEIAVGVAIGALVLGLLALAVTRA